ncbi:MAG: hypothetical protein ACOZFS_02750 [Thermodesulfobacteriota bacterium]
MNGDLKAKAASGLKKTWCSTWTFTVNTGRRMKILARKGLGYWQQRKINKAMGILGLQTFQALEQGESNPLMAPEVNAAVQKVKGLKEIKEKNYQAIAAIRERIQTSCVFATPDQPGAMEENPEVPG